MHGIVEDGTLISAPVPPYRCVLGGSLARSRQPHRTGGAGQRNAARLASDKERTTNGIRICLRHAPLQIVTATDLTICDKLPTVRTPVQIVLNAVTRKNVRMQFGIRGASTRAVPIFNLSRADMGAPDFTNARRQGFAQAGLLVR